MEDSYFMDRDAVPTEADLKAALGDKHILWTRIVEEVHAHYQGGLEEWNFPGKKYGWSFRIKDKRRAILYLLPYQAAFKVAFVFGQKAFDQVMESKVSPAIKKDLAEARVYAEGRGVRLPVDDASSLEDIFTLLKIKLAN